ncbi:MAG: sigma-70 family RNA polymerase sigma factor [Acidobacteriota bacterium]|nr:sigma-70 family RNA polymerase sigma factor [Acidobacteriota bacterium]
MVENRTGKEDAVPAASESSVTAQRERKLEELFDAHADRVLRAAYRLTGNAEDAEDVLQTVFLRLARRENAPDLRPSPGSYLQRAAVNAALDQLRARRSRVVELDGGAPGATLASNGTPEDDQRGRDLRRALRSALSDMSPKVAEIFVLRDLEGYGNREIAQMVDSTPGSVAVLLHRARRELRERFRDFLGDGS